MSDIVNLLEVPYLLLWANFRVVIIRNLSDIQKHIPHHVPLWNNQTQTTNSIHNDAVQRLVLFIQPVYKSHPSAIYAKTYNLIHKHEH